MSSNVKTNHTIFFSNNILPPNLSKHERKICMQKYENDAEKLIRKVTLNIIEIENVFFLLRRCVSKGTTLHIQSSSTQKFKNVYL